MFLGEGTYPRGAPAIGGPCEGPACRPGETAGAPDAPDQSLLRLCLEGLSPVLARRAEVLDVLDDLIACGDPEVAGAARRSRKQLLALEPAVTMIGQVKAGKTSLVNAMVGEPGLLPADVNPWTSVVTSLHIGPDADKAPYAARFTFFDPEDWERLTRTGGRVGELAGRSGAEDEAEKVRRQIEAMREKTRRRLGRKFELLLGTSHKYGTLTRELIERYVCLGDDFGVEDEESGRDDQGRFADITKAADLRVHRPDWPMDLCLRDTPGVNDTFMMREQITIGAIRDSRLCVVVLSAHQALSSVDMALIRLISNVQSREVIIFVNRIDELSDPGTQIEEIRASIRDTLKAHHGPEDAEIVFGSAHWATLALQGDFSVLDDEEGSVLLAYAEQAIARMDRELGPLELIWWLSGVPSLYNAIWSRITDGAARERIQTVARQAMNLAVGLAAVPRVTPLQAATDCSGAIDVAAMDRALEALEQRVQSELDAGLRTALQSAGQRLERSHHSFLDRATAALVQHLDTYGEMAPWSYDPAGLRLLLRSGFQVFLRQVRSAGATAGEAAAREVAAIYARAFARRAEEFQIQPPTLPRVPPPVLIGQTIALDLKGNWWRRWWSRHRGYQAFAPEFHAMIEAETRPIVNALMTTHCAPAGELMRRNVAAFFEDQRTILASLRSRAAGDGTVRDDDARSQETLAQAVSRLRRFAA